MAKEIGAFVNADGMTTLLNKPCQLIIFRKQEGFWRIERKLALNLGEAGGLAELRVRVGEIIKFLAQCSIVLAEAFQGAALHELEKAGVALWEVAGEPEPLLDHILSEEENSTQEQEQTAKIPFPVLENKGNGRYFISIAQVQRSGGALTSKQVLLPIVQQGSFQKLEVLCTHVPPWLEAEAVNRGWEFAAKINKKQELCATITVP